MFFPERRLNRQQTTERDIDKAAARIRHVRSHALFSDGHAEALDFILRRAGNVPACAMELAGHALASAMVAWFDDQSIERMRQHFYVAASLDQFWYPLNKQHFSPRGNFLHMLSPLLSNHHGLTEWFIGYEPIWDMKRVENHKTSDFWAYQVIVALQGNWPRLLARCNQVMENPPGASCEQKYLVDHRFYLALAEGDLAGMEVALADIASSKVIRSRDDDESGFTADLIFTPAVIYAKIAWWHGHEVRPNHPFIPAEWLPMTPLVHYECCYPFLA